MRRLRDAERRALLVDRQLVGGDGEDLVVPVVETVGPLHATDPSSVYLQVAARGEATAADVATALYDDKALLRHTTLRRTVHVLTPELAVAAHGAYNHRIVPKLRAQLVGWIESSGATTGGDAEGWLGEVEDTVVQTVAGTDRPTGNELAELLPELRTVVEPAPGKSYSRPMRITSKVLELLIADGRIARDRPRSGDLSSGAWTYGTITDWLPGGLGDLEPEPALAALVDHRLRAFPGSSDTDLAWWTGLPKGQVRKALTTVGAEKVERDDGVIGWVAADDDLTVPEPGPDTVALLPGLDATPMGCKQRDWFLGPYESLLFDRNGNVGPTIWCRGRIVGGWTHRRDGVVATELLESVPDTTRAAVGAEAERLAAWLGEVRVNWRYPTPLQRSLELDRNHEFRSPADLQSGP